MILDQIVERVKLRLQADKEKVPLENLLNKAAKAGNRPDFYEALKKPGLSLIAEFKKASPSLGIIDQNTDPARKAAEYISNGASAISVLTERDFFKGSLTDLESIAAKVNIPILRKDFIIDPYQVIQAKIFGASGILLIAAILSREQLSSLIRLSNEYCLDVLVEVHNEEEINKALHANARIIGINNRDLRTFSVNLDVSNRLRAKIPHGIISVCESGIRNTESLNFCRAKKFDAVLVGEAMMRGYFRPGELALGGAKT